MKKNEEYIVTIVDQGNSGEGIAKIDGITIFINGAIKGEKVKIVITKVLSSFAYGRILTILEKSKERKDTDCATYKKCGGCALRHIKYAHTLKIKTEIVENCLNKAYIKNANVSKCIGMKEPYFYRNKLQYPVGEDENGKIIMGVYAKRSHDIIETRECQIQDKICNEIANEIFELLQKYKIKAYNEKTQSGCIRHIIIRKGKKTGDVMVVLVTNTKELKNSEMLVKELTTKFKDIKTIVQNINSKNTNVILGDEIKVIFGNGYIEDYIGEYKFKISSLSFYQVNPIQTEVLYNKALEFAELSGEEIIYDLYCGIGTIGIFASKKAKKIYGIEVVEQAIENAKENAILNDVKNAKYMTGEVEKILPDLIKTCVADVVFIDPPRKGCDRKVIDMLLEVVPKKIVYISCNPATFARDVGYLKEKYVLGEVQPVDMFPFTNSIECVGVLNLIKRN